MFKKNDFNSSLIGHRELHPQTSNYKHYLNIFQTNHIKNFFYNQNPIFQIHENEKKTVINVKFICISHILLRRVDFSSVYKICNRKYKGM